MNVLVLHYNVYALRHSPAAVAERSRPSLRKRQRASSRARPRRRQRRLLLRFPTPTFVRSAERRVTLVRETFLLRSVRIITRNPPSPRQRKRITRTDLYTC